MALTVTGVDANGRVTPKGTNVIIPPESAGIGDIVLMNSSRDVKIVGWGTYSSGSLPSGYVAYGVIYGFVNGMAMIVALGETSLRWAMYGPGTDSTAPTSTGAENMNPSVSRTTAISTGARMRNGKTATYAAMNLATLKGYIGTSSSGQSRPLHPGTADGWSGANSPMTKADFEANAEAVALYGTWDNYMRQLLRVNGAPGTAFGFHDSGIKVHEQGRVNTFNLGVFGPGSGTYASTYPGSLDGNVWYPAANYCYNYYVPGAGETASSHNWWLPSMFELGELMIDEHWSKVNTCGATTLSRTAIRWSSIRYSATFAWSFHLNGFCNRDYVRYALTTRAVSLLKIK